MAVRHPAKFTSSILDLICEILETKTVSEARVLDPFAGTGKIHLVPRDSYGVELEPEWALLNTRTLVGNALKLPFRDESFEVIATSPTYANRMSDHHNAKDNSRRNTYRHSLDRPLHPENSGAMNWGAGYRGFHRLAWEEVTRVAKENAMFLLNIKNHIRKGIEVDVATFHQQTIEEIGWDLEEVYVVETPGLRDGANSDLRVDHECVYQFRRTS